LIVLWAGGGGVCCTEQRTFAAAAFLLVAVFPHARIRIGWHSETILMEVVLGQSSLVSACLDLPFAFSSVLALSYLVSLSGSEWPQAIWLIICVIPAS